MFYTSEKSLQWTKNYLSNHLPFFHTVTKSDEQAALTDDSESKDTVDQPLPGTENTITEEDSDLVFETEFPQQEKMSDMTTATEVFSVRSLASPNESQESPFVDEDDVITSYSIHYTKLYEMQNG